MKTSQTHYSQFILPLCAALAALELTAAAAPITWAPPVTIAGDTDVSTAGTLLYAYNNSGTNATVNTVPFAGVTGSTAWSTNLFFGSGWSSTAMAFGSSSGTPWNGLSTNYKFVLGGGAYGGAGPQTITLSNLLVGESYLVQTWVVDNRTSGLNRNENLLTTGGNVPTLNYNNTGAAGGVGQYSLGTFKADAATEVVTVLANSSAQLNAIQVRDQGVASTATPVNGTNGVWASTTSGALWGTAVNWVGSTVASGSNSVADFSQLNLAADILVNVDATRVVGSLVFGNTAATPAASWNLVANNSLATNYLVLQGSSPTITVNNLGAGKAAFISATLGGAGGLTTAGPGTLVLTNANTFSGGLTVSSGTLIASNQTALGSGTVATINGTLDLASPLAATFNYSGLTGTLSGSGTINALLSTGGNALGIGGNNTGFTGTLNIGTNGLGAGSIGGKLSLFSQNGGLPAAATVNVLSNATLYLFNAVTQAAALTLYGGTPGEVYGQLRLDGGATWSGPVTLAGPVFGAGVGNLGCNSGTSYITGNIGQRNGAQSVVKTGGAALVLSGTNSYTGPTLVNQGSLTFLGNQTGVTGGFYVGTNANAVTLNIGSGTQTVPTMLTVGPGAIVKTASGASQYSTLNTAGTAANPTYVTNNSSMSIGRDSGFSAGANSTWVQNADLTVQANGGYPGNFTVSAGGTYIYAGSPLITNSAPGSSGSASIGISGNFITGQGFYFNDSGSTGLPQLTLATGGVITLSANIPQFIVTGGSGPVGKFFLGANATFNTAGFNTADSLVLANASGQAGSLLKTGAGTLELDAVNTYTGPTTVAGGTLLLGASAGLNSGTINLTNNATFDVSALGTYYLAATNILAGNGTINGSVADSTGTQFYPGGNGAIGALNFNSNLSLAGGDTLNYDFSSGGSNDVILVGGALILNGTTTINLAKWPLTSGFKVGTYVLLQATNGIGGGGNFVLLNAPGRQNCNVVLNTSGAVQQVLLTVGNSGAPASLLWAGGQNNNSWDTQSTSNWLNSGSPDYFYSGDAVSFGNVPAANAAVNISGAAVAPGSVVFTGTNNYVLESSGGYITGIGSLTLSGSGSVTLATANDYSGGTVINSGSLILGDGIANDGFILGTITDNAALIVANPADEILSNNVVGSGTLYAAGPGLLTLAGSNSYTGGTLVNSNTTLVAAVPGALGSPVASNLVTVSTSGVLSLGSGVNFTLTNLVTGGGALVQKGPSGTTLLTSNGFTGGVTIELGAIIVGNSNALGTGPILIDNQGAGGGAYSQLFLKNGVTLTNAITLGTASSYYQGILMVDAGGYGYGGANGSGGGSDTNGATFAGPITFAPGTVGHGGQFTGPINGTNWLFIAGPVTNTGGTVIVRNGRVQFSGGGDYAGLTVAAQITSLGANNGVSTNASLGIAGSGNATFDLRGFNQALNDLSSSATYTALITNSAANPSTLTLTPTSSTFGGIIGGNINLVINGTGSVNLTATNTYTGNTTVNGGTLEFGNAQFATNSTVTIASGATLQLDAATTNLVGSLVIDGVIQPPGVYNNASTPAITGSGTLIVVATGPGIFTNPTAITGMSLNGANLTLTATNGQAGCAYYLLTTTNVASPVTQWKVVATNVLAGSGPYTFVGTNVVIPAAVQQYFLLSSTNYNH